MTASGCIQSQIPRNNEIRCKFQARCQKVEQHPKNCLLPSHLQIVEQMEHLQKLMTNSSNPLTLPTREPRRTKTLNMRLSEAERDSVDRLAEMQGVTASELARHFLLQAVSYYSQKRQGEAHASGQFDG
jgi:hypothetical protein